MTILNLPTWLLDNLEQNSSRPEPTWLANFRGHHREDCLKTGLSRQRNEHWKYTNLACLEKIKCSAAAPVAIMEKSIHDSIKARRLVHSESIFLVCINGFYAPQFSDLTHLPHHVIVCSLQQALAKHAELLQTYWLQQIHAECYPFASLNASLANDGLFLYVAGELTLPIHILWLMTDHQECVAHSQQIIVLEKESKAYLLEEHIAAIHAKHVMNMVTSITISAGAHLEYYKYRHESKKNIHFAHTMIQQQENSFLNHVNYSSSNLFARDDLLVKLNHLGAHCTTSGFYRLQHDGHQVNHHVDIEHRAPSGRSEMLYKGIVEKKSQAVFSGRVHVTQQAEKTVAQQANHHLLLDNQAEAYSKPELEIYADDVKCQHGATTGEVDQDAVFYLCSRGISYQDALNILLQGFADEIMQRVAHVAIRKHIQNDEVAVI